MMSLAYERLVKRMLPMLVDSTGLISSHGNANDPVETEWTGTLDKLAWPNVQAIQCRGMYSCHFTLLRTKKLLCLVFYFSQPRVQVRPYRVSEM